MKSNKEKLLTELLRDLSADARRDILDSSLQELRRRRRARRMRAALPLAMAASVALILGLVIFSRVHRLADDRRGVSASVAQAPTEPARAPMDLVTNHWPAMDVVASGQYASVVVDNASVQRHVEILGDAELLALFPDRPAGLVANALGEVQLVFLDSRNQDFRP